MTKNQANLLILLVFFILGTINYELAMTVLVVFTIYNAIVCRKLIFELILTGLSILGLAWRESDKEKHKQN